MPTWKATDYAKNVFYEVPLDPAQLDEDGHLTPEARDALLTSAQEGRLAPFARPLESQRSPVKEQDRADIVGRWKQFLIGLVPGQNIVSKAVRGVADLALPGSLPAAAAMAALSPGAGKLAEAALGKVAPAAAAAFSSWSPGFLQKMAVTTAAGAALGATSGDSTAGAAEAGLGFGLGKAAEAVAPSLGGLAGRIAAAPEAQRWIHGFPDRLHQAVQQILPVAAGATPQETITNLTTGKIGRGFGQAMETLEEKATQHFGDPTVILPEKVVELFGLDPQMSATVALQRLRGLREQLYHPNTVLRASRVEAAQAIREAEDHVFQQLAHHISSRSRPEIGQEWLQTYEKSRRGYRQASELQRLFLGESGRNKPQFKVDQDLFDRRGMPNDKFINQVREGLLGMEGRMGKDFDEPHLAALWESVGLRPENATARVSRAHIGVGFRSQGAVGSGGFHTYIPLHGQLFPQVPHITDPLEQRGRELGRLARNVVRYPAAEAPTLAGEGE